MSIRPKLLACSVGSRGTAVLPTASIATTGRGRRSRGLERVERDLSDGFVDLGGRPAHADAAEVLPVHNDGQPTLVRKELGVSEDFDVPALHLVGAVFRRALVESSVPRFLLGELQGV